LHAGHHYLLRYYGYYSNVKWGTRKNNNQDEWMPCILEANESSKEYRKNWARLIQKIYKVDPLNNTNLDMDFIIIPPSLYVL